MFCLIWYRVNHEICHASSLRWRWLDAVFEHDIWSGGPCSSWTCAAVPSDGAAHSAEPVHPWTSGFSSSSNLNVNSFANSYIDHFIKKYAKKIKDFSFKQICSAFIPSYNEILFFPFNGGPNLVAESLTFATRTILSF